MKKEISFSTQGRSKYFGRTKKFVEFLLKKSSGYCDGIPEGVDIDYLYTEKGAKITTELKKRLKHRINKKWMDIFYPDFCNEWVDLYEPRMEFRFFWGIKKDLGEGVYEQGDTCFRRGGENEQSKDYLALNHRVRVLVLEDGGDSDTKARVIVHFIGGRRIILTNFYYKGIKNDKEIFVEGIRRMFGLAEPLDYSQCTKSETKLPIYLNGDYIMIKAGRDL